MILAVFAAHPHPVIRLLFGVAVLGAIFLLLGLGVYFRLRQREEVAARLKSLEDKLDRLGSPGQHGRS